MKTKFLAAGLTALLLLGASATVNASAGTTKPGGGGTSSTWTGQGITSDGEGGYNLNTSQCDAKNTPYVLFVLASSKSTAAKITIGTRVVNATMTKSTSSVKGESSFKYTYLPASNIDLAALLKAPVTATYDGSVKVSLTASHGCVGSPVTVTYLGEGAPDATAYDSMGHYVAGLGVKVCQKGSTTRCADFPNTTSSPTDKKITLSANPKNLDFIVTGATSGELCTSGTPKVRVFSSSVAVSALLTTTPADEFTGNGTSSTTATYSGGDHLYFATYCEIPSPTVTVTFLGEGAPETSYYDDMGYYVDGLGVKVCETGLSTGCVDFPDGTGTDNEQTITLTADPKKLDFIATGGTTGPNCASGTPGIKVFDSAVAANDFLSTATPTDSFSGNTTSSTTGTYSDGDHVYFATYCEIPSSPTVTVTFIGEGAPSTSYYDDMGYYVDGLGVKVCETGLSTGCVDFPDGTGTDNEQTITLTADPKKLDFIATGGTTGPNCATGTPGIKVFDSAVAANDFLSTATPTDSFSGNTTSSTTGTFADGDHVYFATYCDTSGGGSGGSGGTVTVTFLGESLFGVYPYRYGNLGADITGLAVKVCETGSNTGCADFASGTTPNTDKTVTLTSTPKALDFTTTGGGGCTLVKVFASSVTADAFFGTSGQGISGGSVTDTTTSTYSDGGHVYFATRCDVS